MSKTRDFAKQSAKNLSGVLGIKIKEIRTDIFNVLSKIIALIDFPEYVAEPEYDYIISVSGNRYLASHGQDVKRGASATTHSKPPIRLSAYGGSTFAVYLLN